VRDGARVVAGFGAALAAVVAAEAAGVDGGATVPTPVVTSGAAGTAMGGTVEIGGNVPTTDPRAVGTTGVVLRDGTGASSAFV